MQGTYLIITIIIYLLICVIWAFFRGASRSKLRLIMVFCSAVAAYLGTLLIKAFASSDKILARINELAADIGFDVLEKFAQFSPSLEEILLKSGTAIAAPAIFLMLFLAFSIGTWIIYFILTLVLFPLFRRSEEKKMFRKLRASINGLLQGAIVVIVFMLPITCYLEMAPIVADKALQSDTELSDDIILTKVKDEIDGFNSSLTVNTFRSCGGSWLYEQLTSFSIGQGENKTTVCITDEVGALFDFVNGIAGLSGKDITEYSEHEADLILGLGESFSDSKLLATATSDLVYNMTSAWKNGETFAGISEPSVGEMLDPMFDKLITVFNESSQDTEKLSEDIITVSKLVSTLSRYGVLANTSNTEALTKVLSESNAVTEISDILSENERMKVILTDLTDLSVDLLAKSLGVPEENTEMYNDMLSAIAGSLTDTRDIDPDTRKELVKVVVKDELVRAGINVEDDYIIRLTDTLIENYGDFDGEITPAFIAQFYTVYTNMQSK